MVERRDEIDAGLGQTDHVVDVVSSQLESTWEDLHYPPGREGAGGSAVWGGAPFLSQSLPLSLACPLPQPWPPSYCSRHLLLLQKTLPRKMPGLCPIHLAPFEESQSL